MAARIIHQSGVIPFRQEQGRLEVLVITSSDGQRWGVPKGLLEPGLTPAASAAKEALEEAGVRGHVFPDSIGTYSYPKWGGTCRVEMFLLRVDEVLESWDEMYRTREWVGVDEAARRMAAEGLRQMLRDLPGRVASLPPG
jgi:8-oxo-dGTP pyrophosphatase MutT (NUDIX family)